jgi:hypothetical protein
VLLLLLFNEAAGIAAGVLGGMTRQQQLLTST